VSTLSLYKFSGHNFSTTWRKYSLQNNNNRVLFTKKGEKEENFAFLLFLGRGGVEKEFENLVFMKILMKIFNDEKLHINELFCYMDGMKRLILIL